MINIYLKHYGVKGMRWGHRRYNGDAELGNGRMLTKKRAEAFRQRADRIYERKRKEKGLVGPTKGYSDAQRLNDRKYWGTNGQLRIESKIRSGKSKNPAEVAEYGRFVAKRLLKSVGMLLVVDQIKNDGALRRAAGQKVVDSYFKSKAAKTTMKSIPKITQNPKFNPIDVPWRFVD